jgi:hypothetical protein
MQHEDRNIKFFVVIFFFFYHTSHREGEIEKGRKSACESRRQDALHTPKDPCQLQGTEDIKRARPNFSWD